jgi:hypothetical protein
MLSEARSCDVLFVQNSERSVFSFETKDVDSCTSMFERKNASMIFYDQASTVGIDFTQKSLMRGLVTVDRMTTWTAVAQAAFRLRRLGRGHSIDFLVADSPDGAFGKLFRNPTDRVRVLHEADDARIRARFGSPVFFPRR